MSRDKREYTIKITKTGSTYDAQLFAGSSHIGATQAIVFNKNADGLKKTAHYKLNFKIDDSALPQGERVRFLTNDADVMSVWTDLTQCPPQGNHMDHSFWVDKNNNGRELTLINMDLKVEKLRFQLFMETNGTPPVPVVLDPIVENGNNGAPEGFVSAFLACIITGGIVGVGTAFAIGGVALGPSSAALYGIGGAIVGLVVGLLASRN